MRVKMKFVCVPRLFASALLLLFAGCGDTAGSDPLKRVYVLSTIDGRQMPQPTVNHSYSDGSRTIHTLLSESLVVVSDTSLSRRRVRRFASYRNPSDPGFINEDRFTESGVYRRRGNVVFVTWDSQIRDTLWVRSNTLVGSEMLGFRCPICPPVQYVEFVYR